MVFLTKVLFADLYICIQPFEKQLLTDVLLINLFRDNNIIKILFYFIFRKEVKTTASDLTDTMKSDKKEIKDKIDGEYAGQIYNYFF